jgi:predicted component of type VI protein secretion system
VLTIGQHVGNRLRIADSRLSSPHAAIVREGETYLLFDCNSSSGTFVNGRHARDVHILRDGDQIEVEDWVLHFRVAAPARRVFASASPGPRPKAGATGAVAARAGRASFGEWRLDELRALRDRAVTAARVLEAAADRSVAEDEGAEAPAPVAFVFADLTGRRWIRLRLLAAVLGAWSLTLAIVFVHFLLR